MMRIFFLFLLLSPFLLPAQENLPQDREAIRSRLVRDIGVLASDSFEGRRSGTLAEKRSYEYIIRRFNEIGLEPKGSDSNSFLQPFPDFTFLYNELKCSLLVNGRNYHYRYDFGATNLSSSGSIEGEIFDAGKGLDIPGAGLDDYADKGDLKGKIALIDISVPRGLSKVDSLTEYLTPRKRIETALSKGANGVIMWNMDSPYSKTLFDFGHPDSVPVPVIFITSDVVEYLHEAPGSKVSISVTIKYLHETYYNVVGYLDHHAPNTVIIGAHYDHMGISSKNGIRYGADDNASGTAMVLELAGYLKQNPDPGNNYLFIAFSGEEEGLLGSLWFAGHPTIDLDQVNFMVNFDMVGRLGCEGKMIYAIGTASSPDWKKIYRSVSPDAFRVRKMKGSGMFSDNLGFYKKEIPVAYFTTGFHYDYHTPDDSPDRINYYGMVDIARYSEDFIRAAAGHDRIRYSKVSGWNQFNANLHYTLEELDYLMVVGAGGAN